MTGQMEVASEVIEQVVDQGVATCRWDRRTWVVEVHMTPHSTMWRSQMQVGVGGAMSMAYKMHNMHKAYMAGWTDLDCMGNHRVDGKLML